MNNLENFTFNPGDQVENSETRTIGVFVKYVDSPVGYCLVDFDLSDLALLLVNNIKLAKKVDGLKCQLERSGYTDKGGELMKPPIGMPPRFDLLDELKNSISEMAQKYRAEAHELSRIRDFEKSQMYSHFANELDRLNKGGA